MTKTQILVVEDEPKIAHLISEVLTSTGYSVITARSGEQALEIFPVEQPDLILLDIVLAKEIDGYEVAKRIRKYSDVPIIMLTAKVRESDLLHGFNVGADDYLTKPFSSKELLARVKAVTKRARNEVKEMSVVEINCGQIKVDLARRVVLFEEREIKLTKTEFDLLQVLAINKNKVLTHQMLLTEVWGEEYQYDIDYLRAYIRYLRRKIEPDPSIPVFIRTSQGAGYYLDSPEDTE